jgi:hypothetical protein
MQRVIESYERLIAIERGQNEKGEVAAATWGCTANGYIKI